MSQFWKIMRQPWLAPLLRQTTLCRVLILTAVALGTLHLLGIKLPCLFSSTTGLPCAGCGITRATTALLRGDLTSALHYHPFSPALFLFGALMTLSALAPKFSHQKIIPIIHRLEARTLLPTILAIAFILFGILRTIGLLPSPPLSPPLRLIPPASHATMATPQPQPPP